jgi:GT2 family glycosyltransferase
VTSIVVITLVRAAAVAGEVQLLMDALAGQLSATREHLVLVNDPATPEMLASLERPHTTAMSNGSNLGVAAGRQLLLEAALARGAELIVSLDDDLVIPLDLLDGLDDALVRLQGVGHRVGMLGPLVLAGDAAVKRLGRSSEELRSATCERLAAFVQHGEPLRPRDLYHAGIGPWQSHYLRAVGSAATELRNGLGVPIEAAEQRRVSAVRRGAGTADPRQVDTLPGGVCAVTADAVRAVGGIDQRYGPFGYEDAGFAVAVRDAGYVNFSLPSVLVVHDLTTRAAARPGPMTGLTSGRGRSLLAFDHASSLDAADILETFLLSPLLGAVDRGVDEGVDGLRHLAAWSMGVAQAAFRSDDVVRSVEATETGHPARSASLRVAGGAVAVAGCLRGSGNRMFSRRRGDLQVSFALTHAEGLTTARWEAVGPIKLDLAVRVGPHHVTVADPDREAAALRTATFDLESARWSVGRGCGRFEALAGVARQMETLLGAELESGMGVVADDER